jgi:hypothetical protein
MKIIILSIFIFEVFIPLTNGAFAETSTEKSVRQLNANLVAEQTYLTELKALSKTPKFQDKTSKNAKDLSNRINESQLLIKLTKETLHSFLPRKFCVTYVGSRSRSAQSHTLSHSDASECLTQLLENIRDEQTHLSELKAMLNSCPDQTSIDAQKLRHKIKECRRILNYFNDSLVGLMYPNRFKESLQQEARQNCLWHVKLVLHKNGCFHIPKLTRTNILQSTH